MSEAKKRPTTEDLLAALDRAERDREVLLAALSGRHQGNVPEYVGIRNVSSYTIGLPKSPVAGEPDVQLYPEFGGPNPNSIAIVSAAWWHQLRKGKHMERGMIIRDDSVLGQGQKAAPPDLPHEIAANHAKNVVLDPHKFITDKSEADLRIAIEAITSEESLRRLWATVDEQVAFEREKIPVTGNPSERENRAVRNLPAMYKLAEDLVRARLEEVAPPSDV